MNKKSLAENLRSGRTAVGTLIVSTSPRWPVAMAGVGFDFVFIDTEHVAIGRENLSWMCQTYGALGLPPLVRIPSPDPYQACMALDGGAAGVVAPYVETVSQVEALRGAVKLRPLKGERLDAVLRNEATLETPLAAYLAANNTDSLLIINIESTPAIDRLDALLSVPGVDAVLIGPHDLSCSLGIPEQYDDPMFEDAVRTIILAARRHGVAAGMHAWLGVDRFVKWAAMGLNLIVYSADILAMRDTLSTDLGELRARLGVSAVPPPAATNI